MSFASLLLSPKACIPVRRSYACWCRVLEYSLFLLPKKTASLIFDFRWSWAASCPPIGTRQSANTLFIVLCVTVGIAPQTLFYCLCVQLPLFPFYEQWKICRVLFRGTSSPAVYQYVRLHSRYVFLTTHFHKDYSCEGQWCAFPTISQRLLGQVRTSYRCIKPVFTSQNMRFRNIFILPYNR